ncbi:M35 family metallo-endopeptidase [Aliikangiella sp. G2MR2-5]|uniref:M35 family metallo-endopeptidase n=1 Tax=Aliikangiella sp. G2MR2-5 TaxID=2788943 RepID=UPI0018A885AD|nr:M35 family metallo-endopeptidase [Aliikangiella sp. G2MR2-5]
MNIKRLISAFALLLFSSIGMAKVHSGIEVKVQAAKKQITNDQDVTVKVSYKNRTGQAIKLLKWYLPDNNGNLEEGIFKITLDGETIDYLGPHYKRPAPTEGDYLVLKANQKISFDVELSHIYDLSEQGYYQISVEAENFEMFGLSKPGKANAKSVTKYTSDSSAEIFVTKVRASKGKPCNPRKQDCGGDGGGNGEDVSFTGSCTNSEQSTILSALAAAKDMANDSVTYLNGNSAGSRYTTWFGTYSSTRWNTVAGNFDAIKDALDNKPKTFDCGCNQSYFAYVYPNQPYKIYLCRAFWSASLTGTDSKGGTIIHEMSHFNAVAGTDDIVYGQSGAKNLAISDPNKAVTNADSHEYFAENSPKLN